MRSSKGPSHHQRDKKEKERERGEREREREEKKSCVSIYSRHSRESARLQESVDDGDDDGVVAAMSLGNAVVVGLGVARGCLVCTCPPACSISNLFFSFPRDLSPIRFSFSWSYTFRGNFFRGEREIHAESKV